MGGISNEVLAELTGGSVVPETVDYLGLDDLENVGVLAPAGSGENQAEGNNEEANETHQPLPEQQDEADMQAANEDLVNSIASAIPFDMDLVNLSNTDPTPTPFLGPILSDNQEPSP
jgi:hypothetical protein